MFKFIMNVPATSMAAEHFAMLHPSRYAETRHLGRGREGDGNYSTEP